ncbi:MAG: putative Ig domain-containing protein [Synergistaceae bacterium]|nr:putative Ig domain-containing protein [Synergistaceae bacterium]
MYVKYPGDNDIGGSNAAPVITSVNFPTGVVGESYYGYFTASGTAPIEYSISAVGRANGFVCNEATGVITGMPITEHTFTMRITAENSAGSDTRDVSITVVNNGKGPRITTSSLPNAKRGEYYSQAITETGGTYPIKWAVQSGSLPPGLSLSNTSARTTYLTGTPNTNGDYEFTISATDSSNTPSGRNLYGTKKFKISVADPPKITNVYVPSGVVGESYSGYFKASGTAPIEYSISAVGIANGLVCNDSTGGLTGVPITEHTFTMRITAENSAGSDTRDVSITVVNNGKGPQITTASLPNAKRGEYYSQAITETGGTYPIKWAVQSGSLPQGLSLSNTSARTTYLTGTPNTNGDYEFTITATDSSNTPSGRNLYGFKKFKISVANPVTINYTFMNGTVGKTYSDYVTASGGTSPYTWTKTSGTLPPGLSLSWSGSTCYLKGTPSKAGTYTFCLQAKDAYGNTSSPMKFTVVINSIKLSVNSTFMNGTVGKTYSDYVTASGGTSPYTWTKTSGTLPTGLSLSWSGSTCYLKGTPSEAGTYTFYLQAKDNYGSTSDAKSFTVVVNSTPSINGTFKNATVGQSYSGSISVTGGTAPYTWTKTSGSLPTNLSLSGSGSTCYLKGTLTKAGNYTFTLKVTDANKLTATKSFTMKVSPAISLSGTMASTSVGQSYSKTLTISGGASPYTASYSGSMPAGIKPAKSGSSIKFSGKPTKSGTSSFKVTVTDDNGAKLTKSYTITTIAKLAASGSFTNYGTLNKSYSSSITVSGGTPNYTSSYTGTLPKGLKFTKSSTGSTIKLSGTPTKTGTYSFKLTIKDKAGTKLTTKSFTVKISNPLQVSGSFRSTGKLNQSYSASSIKISGGVSPYKYARTGSLPTGMSLSLSGSTLKLYGTPKTSGKKTFTLKITDKDGRAVSKTFALTISQTTKTASVAAETTAQPTSEKGITGDKVATIAIPNLGSIAHEDELGADEPEIEIEEEVVAGHSKPVVKVGLQVFAVSDENILETGTERDEDLVKVRAGNPVTFEIVDVDFEKIAPEKFTVLYDFEPVENDDIIIEEDGSFTLPAELVTGDFAISVKAEDENYEYESGELFIEAVSDQASEAEE